MLKTLSDAEVQDLQAKAVEYHEGMEYVGYWPAGDSVILRLRGHIMCISRDGLNDLTADANHQAEVWLS